MKVLLINGSPNKKGNTFMALSEVASVLNASGIDTEIVGIGKKPVMGCVACNKCVELGYCAFQDDLYLNIREQLKVADGLIVGSPVYFAGANGSLCALLDRIFVSCSQYLQYKPASAIAVCRRTGISSTLDRLNKYFTIRNMPIVPSQYWNGVHGAVPGEILQDMEGMQTIRTMARNMAWMLKNLKPGTTEVPNSEQPSVKTNFVR